MFLKPRTRTLALAATVIAFSGTPAKADNFLFDITNPFTNESVTGEIFGLTDNSTGAAASIVILTQPFDFFSLYHSTTATNWQNISANAFTETSGVITAASFSATDLYQYNDEPPGFGDQAYFDLGTLRGSLEEVNIQQGFHIIDGPVIFTRTPEPSSAILLSTMLLAVALWARKRTAPGLSRDNRSSGFCGWNAMDYHRSDVEFGTDGSQA